MVKAMEGRARESNDGKEVAQKQLQDLKENHCAEMNEMRHEYD